MAAAFPLVESPLTDRLLRSWLRCRRRAWLDRHGDPQERLWTAHRALQLDDQRRSFSTVFPDRPGHGLAAARAGAPAVVGLRLRGGASLGLPLEAHPPLLQRVEGSSLWGEHAYRPVLVRQGRNLTREHRLVLSFWGTVLAEEQRAAVPSALVLAGVGQQLVRQELPLAGLHSQMSDALARMARDLGGNEAPPLVADRKKCVLCSWRGLCDREAAHQGHLSEVSGIGAKRREMLLELGISSLAELAAAEPDGLAERLAAWGEQHAEMAPQLVTQARVQRDGQPQRRDGAPALPELAEAAGVLLYDIESDPDARDDFLHGFVRLARRADGTWPDPDQARTLAPYHPLLALQEHGEARLWARLRRLLQASPGWPVLHFGETESLALVRMAQRQGAREAELIELKQRLVDVHQRLRRHWWLPVNGYGLKPVASWLGFRWRQKGVDGARALLWWRQWRLGVADGSGRGSRDNLRRIFRYNHDDSLATWTVAHWMLAQEAEAP